MTWTLDRENPERLSNFDLDGDKGERVVYAARALFKGTANEVQQKLIWDWLMYVTAQDGSSFVRGPDGDRVTAFAEGKRFVGLQLRALLNPSLTPKKS